LDLFQKFDKEIKKYISDNPKTLEALNKELKVTKKKAIPDTFTLYEKVGSYFVLNLTNVEKCQILETEFKKRGLHYVLD